MLDLLSMTEQGGLVKGSWSVPYMRGRGIDYPTPAEPDKEILSAMAARDDAGTLPEWVIYNVLAWPSRLVYVSLFVVAALVYHRYRRAERMEPISA